MTINWIIPRTLTFLNVYVFYFLLLHNYRRSCAPCSPTAWRTR